MRPALPTTAITWHARELYKADQLHKKSRPCIPNQSGVQTRDFRRRRRRRFFDVVGTTAKYSEASRSQRWDCAILSGVGVGVALSPSHRNRPPVTLTQRLSLLCQYKQHGTGPTIRTSIHTATLSPKSV